MKKLWGVFTLVLGISLCQVSHAGEPADGYDLEPAPTYPHRIARTHPAVLAKLAGSLGLFLAGLTVAQHASDSTGVGAGVAMMVASPFVPCITTQLARLYRNCFQELRGANSLGENSGFELEAVNDARLQNEFQPFRGRVYHLSEGYVPPVVRSGDAVAVDIPAENPASANSAGI